MKNNRTYDFQKLKTTRSFGRKILNSAIMMNDVSEQQINSKDNIDKLLILLDKRKTKF